MRLTRGETADETLVANQGLRARAADLRAQTNALMLRYRRHGFQPICGSSDASEDDSVRRRLRDFLSGAEPRTLYGGYSRGSVCRACGNIIKPGELEYDVAGATSVLHLDAACYKILIEEWHAEAREDSPDVANDTP